MNNFLEMREVIMEFVLFPFWRSMAIQNFHLEQSITYRKRRAILGPDTADITAFKS